MKRIHYLSGITITVFIGLHLFNHVVGIFGADKHIEVMTVLRHFYRNLFAEIILLSAVLVQIISGISLFVRGRKHATNDFEMLHLWTGIYMAVFLIIHLSAVITGRFVLNLDTNFYFGVAGLNTFPHNMFFIPYYGLAILSFFGHIAAIHKRKMKQPILGVSPSAQSVAILVSGAVLTLLIFYGLTNQFHGVPIPDEYGVLVGK
ncbi:hypothetical protein JMN32_13750 [Fulvivirga sp. 29W222]|uniref:DUF4405 domain-containing protein n=1 Tax=Fulvivirga marina TaxID=2494733 RepID=A0A937KEP5_9BACT|nr:hypothetical protein [Fulvivirga marina]MBL6447378.1 hypothetical protein [Fulvivirga marina]